MDSYSLIHENIQPVILGSSRTARAVAKAFFSQYRIISYLCDTKRPTYSFFSVCSAFVKLEKSVCDDINCDVLSRLAASDRSCVWLLVVCDEHFRGFAERTHSVLENTYIISNADAIRLSHPLLSDFNF